MANPARTRISSVLAWTLLTGLFFAPATRADDLQSATQRAVRTAIESPTLLGHWLMKPQYTVSRNGRFAVYAVQTASIATNGYSLSLWEKDLTTDAAPRLVVDLRGQSLGGILNKAHALTSDPNQPINPSLSPDGSKLAIVGYSPTGELAIVDVKSGKVDIVHPQSGRQPLTGSPHYEDVAWSPDGRKLAVTFGEVVWANANVGTEISVDWNGILTAQMSRLAIIDMSNQSLYAETPNDLDVMGFSGAFSWSPDGKHVAFSARRVTDSTYNSKWTDIFEFDVESQKVRPLVVQDGTDIDPHWSPDGRTIAYLTDAGTFRWGKGLSVGLYSLSRGRSRYLLQSEETGGSAFALSWYDSNRVLFTGMRHMGCPLYLGTVSDLSVRAVSPEDLGCIGTALPAAGNTVIAGSHSFANSSVLVRSSLAQWNPVSIGPAAPAGLPAASVKTISWRSSDGRFAIPAILITPEDGRTGPRPLLVTVNGGPSMVTSDLYDASAQQLIYPALLRGFAVLAPNTRGRGGYGEAFSGGIRDYKDVTPGPFGDVMSGVDYVVDDLHIADPQHLALMGFSYGGLLASYAASHTDRFKVIIEGEGSGDFRDFATQSYGSIEQTGYGSIYGISDPYDPEEAKIFAAQSPFTDARNIKTPLLIECGSESLAKTECLKFFRLVRRKSAAPSTMAVYPRTGHGIFEPSLRYDAAMRETAWIDQWVLHH
jgi:dipeptidyl aminopeptidase/acylaminoacyl peptidase